MKTSVELLTGLGFATCEIHLTGKRSVKTRIPILAAVVLLFVLPAMSSPVTIDFEDGTGNDVVIPASHYAGLTFSNAVWYNYGGKGLGVDAGVTGGGNNWAFPGTSSPIVVSFHIPVSSVSITVRDVGDNGAQLEAFSGVSSVGVDNAVASPGPLTVGLTVNAASIDRIELTQHLMDESSPIQDGVIFDDLSYTPLGPSLLAHWNFDGTPGATETDQSGNGNTLTVSGSPSSVAGKVGGAWYFDGSGEHAVAGSPIFPRRQSFTISAWFRYLDNVNPSRGGVWMQRSGANTVGIGINSGTGSEFLVRDTGGIAINRYPLHGANPDLGTWVHQVCVFTYDSGTPVNSSVTAYENGALEGTTTGSGGYNGDIGTGLDNLRIASKAPGSTFEGDVDDVGIFCVALTAGEAKALYDLAEEATLDYNAGTFDDLKQVHDAGSGSSSAITGASGPDLIWTYASGLGSTEGLSGSSPSFTLVLNGSAGTGLTSGSGAGATGTVVIIR